MSSVGSEVPAAVDWLSALGALAAVVVALLVVYLEYRRTRRDQASRISAWAAEVTEPRLRTETGATVTSEPGQSSVRVAVRNASDAPVYDFEARVMHNYAHDAGSVGSHELHLLPPGDHDVWVDWIELPPSGLAGKPYVDFTFKDENGRRWQRLHDGGLAKDRMSRPGRSAGSWQRLRWRY